jgi:hypothetical protein
MHQHTSTYTYTSTYTSTYTDTHYTQCFATALIERARICIHSQTDNLSAMRSFAESNEERCLLNCWWSQLMEGKSLFFFSSSFFHIPTITNIPKVSSGGFMCFIDLFGVDGFFENFLKIPLCAFFVFGERFRKSRKL